MPYSDERLSDIYDRTSGYCHICGKKLSFSNYCRPGCKGAWEVEHSKARVNGGCDSLNNLYAACMCPFSTKGPRGFQFRGPPWSERSDESLSTLTLHCFSIP